MKKIIPILFMFIFVMNLKAFDEISMLNGKVYVGYTYFNNNWIYRFYDLNGVSIEVETDSIKSVKKLFCEVYTLNNSVYKAHLSEVQSKKLILSDENNAEIEIPIHDLSYILIAGKKLDNTNWNPIRIFPDKIEQTVKNDNSENTSNNYPSVGLAIGMPSIVNAIAAYDTDFGLGFQVSGGYINEKYYGGEFNLNYSFFKRKSAVMHFFIGAGTLSLGREIEKGWSYSIEYNKDWNYFITGFDANVYGFYAKVGMSFGDGKLTLERYNVMASIGYVLRFNE